MSQKQNGVNFSKAKETKERRKLVVGRLEAQLVKGTKPNKNGKDNLPLTKEDITRINKEIGILKERV